MSRSRLFTAASAAISVLALGAFAAQAGAATVATQPCVHDVGVVRSMLIGGSGFTPGGSVSIRYISKLNPNPQFLTSTTADNLGKIATDAYPASFASFKTTLQSFTLIASDDTNPAIAAAAAFQQVKLDYRQSPTVKRPKSKTTHITRGFEPGKPVYLHLRFHGKTRRTVSLGVASGVCGTTSKRLRALPVQRPRVGSWKYYIDQSKTFSLGTAPQLRTAYTVFHIFH